MKGREEKFLTAKQVADRYGLSVQWAYHCPELQEIKRKIGKRAVRWALSDIEEFEKLDRDKATGAKTVPLLEFKAREDEKRRKKLKMDIA